MTDLLWAMWYSPVLLLAVLLVLAVGAMLGAAFIAWVLTRLSRRRARRRIVGLQAEDMEFDIPGMEPR